MRRFITESDEFERVVLRENEFEAVAQRFWRMTAPGWTWIPWKPLLTSPTGGVRPDALLVNEACDAWWVVEVELAHHPESHFRPQFESLADAHYGRHLAPSIAPAGTAIDVEKFGDLLATKFPGLLCIADDTTAALSSACRDFGFSLAALTPFRGVGGTFAVSLNKMPREFVAPAPGQIRHVLDVQMETWGGRLTANVPRSFPRIQEFSMRHSNGIERVAVRNIGSSRRIFMPQGFAPAPGCLTCLVAIDPIRGLYELGEVSA